MFGISVINDKAPSTHTLC